MSDQGRIERKIAAVMEILQSDRKSSYACPSSASIIKAITSQPDRVYNDEPPEETTASDYDDFVYQALFDLTRVPQRFQPCADNPEVIECPKARLMRIGKESEEDGRPSELFRYLMTLTNNGATLRPATQRSMLTAQKYLNIAIAFKKFAATFDCDRTNFKDMKRGFRRVREEMKLYVSESTIDRALKAHDIEWSAYAIDAPRKGKRKTSEPKTFK
jgi:hypothetical protein